MTGKVIFALFQSFLLGSIEKVLRGGLFPFLKDLLDDLLWLERESLLGSLPAMLIAAWDMTRGWQVIATCAWVYKRRHQTVCVQISRPPVVALSLWVNHVLKSIAFLAFFSRVCSQNVIYNLIKPTWSQLVWVYVIKEIAALSWQNRSLF